MPEVTEHSVERLLREAGRSGSRVEVVKEKRATPFSPHKKKRLGESDMIPLVSQTVFFFF